MKLQIFFFTEISGTPKFWILPKLCELFKSCHRNPLDTLGMKEFCAPVLQCSNIGVLEVDSRYIFHIYFSPSFAFCFFSPSIYIYIYIYRHSTCFFSYLRSQSNWKKSKPFLFDVSTCLFQKHFSYISFYNSQKH